MRFPNAAKGMKKVFAAEILSLIAAIALGSTLILSIVFLNFEKSGNETAMGVSGIGLLVFMAGAAVLTILALIFKLIGVVQTSKDEPSFKIVSWLIVFGLIASVIGACFSSNTFVYNLTNAISNVLNFISLLFIILGIGSFAAQLGNSDVVLRCGSQFRLILWIGIVSLIARFFCIFMPSLVASSIVLAFAVLALVLNIIQYILYLVLLAKAKNMLAEA